MIIPSVMFIEMAIDSLKILHPEIIDDEVKEFNVLGPVRKVNLINGLNLSDITVGYLLGLETARMLLATMPKAVENDVSI